MRGGDGWELARERMLESIRVSADPRDPRVLEAFRVVPRHAFVPPSQQAWAYDDRALPIGGGQTISQPSMIAIMLDALAATPACRVLEVGAGSGYAAALLACLAREVDAIEILPELAARARTTLEQLGIGNVAIHVGDGSKGLPTRAPFDRILVSAAPTTVPPRLVEQLAPGGRIAIPIGSDWGQTLLVGEKDAAGEIEWRKDVPCMFVPLIET